MTRQRVVLWLAVVLIAVVAGCSNKVDDGALVTNIKSQMFSDAQLRNASLQVVSDKGQVTLSGSVPSDAARYEAYKIATQTPGVTKVNDQMSVQAAQTSSPAPTESVSPAPKPIPVSKPVPARKEEPRKAHIKQSPPPAHAQFADNSSAPSPTQQFTAQTPPDPGPAAAPAASAPPPVSASPIPPPPPAPQPRQVQVTAGTTVTIRMIDGVDSSVNKAGEIFHASLDAPIVVDNEVLVPRGADVYVRLSNASSAGHISGQSELHLELVKLEFQGNSYPLVSSTYSVSGESRGKDSAKKIGGGAVLGALIGAIAGGGKGAAIGAGVGGGAGTVYQGATNGKAVKIASETKLDFQLDQPVSVTVLPRNNLN